MRYRLSRGYDFVIRSQLPVPGAIPIARSGTAGPADIEIGLGQAALADPIRCDGPYRLGEEGLLFEMQGVADYLCEEGRRITIAPRPGASAQDIAEMLIATALPALLWMRGEPVLHASAFVPAGGDRALAVCGRSKSGKSTVLRAMIAQDSKAVGDDTLRLKAGISGLFVSGLPAQLFWSSEDAVMRRGWPVAPKQMLDSARLGAVFILDDERAVGRPRFRKIAGVEALQALLMQRHRPRVPRLLGTEGCFLSVFAMLAEYEIYRWARPIGATTLFDEEIAFLMQCARLTSRGNRQRTAP